MGLPKLILAVFFAGLLLPTGLAIAATTAEPATQDKIRVALDDNYPPYVFRDDNGELNGYLVDSWKLWQAKTGVRVELLASEWNKALQRMAAGEAQVIDTIFRTPEREQQLDFTPAYVQIPVSIYVHAKIGGITDLKTLRGFLVGVKAGDACADKLGQASVSTLQRYGSYESLVQAAVAGQVKVFCLDEPPANYLLYRAQTERNYHKAFELYSGEFHRAVKKGNKETLALVEQGFAAITPAEQQALRDKWMGKGLDLPPYGRIFGYLLAAILFAAGVFALWVIFLKRTVNQRTAQLVSQKAHLHTLLQTIPDLVWLKDAQGVYLACNPAFGEFFGASEAEIVGKTDYDFVNKELADSFREHDQLAAEAGKPTTNEEWLTFSGRSERWLFETIKTPIVDLNGGLLGVLGIARNINDRKLAEEALRRSEQKFAAAFRASPDAIMITSGSDGRFVEVSDAVERMTGYTRAELLGSSSADFWVDSTDRDRYRAQLQEKGRVVDMEARFLTRSGEMRWGMLSGEMIEIDGMPHVLAIIRDITERKLADARIRRLTQLYAALSQCNQAIVRSASPEALFAQICQVAVDFGGMKMAWVGLMDEARQTLIKTASYGDDQGYLANVQFSLQEDSPYSCGSTCIAVRGDSPYWCQDFINDPVSAPWRERAVRSGWAASAALPIHREGAVIGVFTLYSGEANAFDQEACELLVKMALDIDFALNAFASEAKSQQAEAAVRAAKQRYDELVERIPFGVYQVRTAVSGSIQFEYVSPRFCALNGLQAEAVLADFSQALSAVHPEDRDHFIHIQQEIRKTPRPLRWEGRFIVDGQERWMRVESQPVIQDNGDVVWDGVQIDVTERHRAERELAAANQRLQSLSERLLQVQEEERRMLAHELHDEIGQSLTALKITLQSLGVRPETAALQKPINMAVDITDTALRQIRQMSLDLRPAQLDDLGLPAAIRWNLERQCQLAGLAAQFSADGLPAKFPEAIAIACYRISQEAITNVIKHAQAKVISVRLVVIADRFCLEISDDGRGFDPVSCRDGAGLGMVSMRERALLAGGCLEIKAQPGRGCMVNACFSLSLLRP
ncbi:MAG: domain S-box [Proteobacteria bacterium]|nr:domain S-box [Pseudomonadota bacterium]